MTTDNQSYLRFSIEESVWFQRGQEVDELVSISLYPDITIEEHSQYITIRGALQLTGEYRICKNFSNDMEESNNYTYGRLMNEVNTREDGISELKHRFPVDITIPKNRIQNLDDVYVSIDSFDYELPGNKCLQLVADLSISGISSNQKQHARNYTEEQEEFEPSESQYNQEEMSSSEYQYSREEMESPEDQFKNSSEDTKTLYKYDEEEDDVLEVFNLDKSDEHNQYYYSYDTEDDDGTEDDDLYTPIEVEARREAYYENEYKFTKIEDKGISPQFEMKSREEENKWSYSYMAEMKDSKKTSEHYLNVNNEYENHTQDYHETRDENTLYLTKIFAKDESQDFTRLKMYIVQNGDSLDRISERYDVTTQLLIRVNHLDQERTINDGQILYIPV